MTYDHWKATDPHDREPEQEKNRESVADALDHVIDVLDIIAAMALKAETYAEVAAQERSLGAVRCRVELILGFIDARVVQ